METITIDKISYYKLEDIINKYPNFNKGCKISTSIILKHKLQEDNYIYARLINKQWTESDGNSRKFDKIFITTKWFNNLFSKDSNLNKITDDTQMAPPLIKLKNNEKFFDNDGNVIEIEVRGKRTVDECYFKLYDIMKGFNLPKLRDMITDSKSSFDIFIHYTYFYVNEKTKKIFLTFKGLFSVISLSRKIKSNKVNENTLYRWLLNFYDPEQDIFNNKINIINNQINKHLDRGFVYCAYSKLLNGVKIGFWRSSIETLKSRYVTYYGNDVKLEYVETFKPKKLENKTHKKFKNKNISNELFDKKYLSEYVYYIQLHKIEYMNEYHINDDFDYQSPNDSDLFYNKINNYCDDIYKCQYIYLFSIGIISDVRNEYKIDKNIPDDKLIAKFGRTEDLIRRTREHKTKYGDHIELLTFNLIDPIYVTEAESSLRNYFRQLNNKLTLKIDKKTETELIVIDKNILSDIKDQYSLIGSKYVGRVRKHSEIIKDLTNKYERELLVQQKKILKKNNELIIQQFENKLLKKDNELLRLQLKNK